MTKNHTYGFLIDASRCIDCRSCLVACSVQNDVSMTHTRIWIDDTGLLGDYPNFERFTAPYHCMHCNDPSCVSACTVGALQQNEDGIVVYDDDRCIGCRYCLYACPFEVPNFEWEERLALMVKCDMCVDRVEEGEQPACAATCPTEAIMWGKRDDMLSFAYQRMKDNPGRYVDHVFGEHENGGTSTFYLSPVPFDKLGFPEAKEGESPAHFNRMVTHGTPTVAAGVAIAATGIYLAIERQGKDNAAAKEYEESLEKIKKEA